MRRTEVESDCGTLVHAATLRTIPALVWWANQM